MTSFAWIILAIIATAVLSFATAKIVADGKIRTFAGAWEKLRPAAMEILIESIKIYKANEQGYDAMVDYCVNYIEHQIDICDFLTDNEKTLITSDLIKSIIEPQLEKLWNETEKPDSIEE
jgi:hypothetical protein